MEINKRINYLAVTFLLLFALNLITGFSMILILVSNLTSIKSTSQFSLLLILLLPVIAYLIWKRQKMGWVLGMGYAVFMLFGELLKIVAISWFKSTYGLNESIAEQMSTLGDSILLILFYSAIIWLMNKADFRIIFQVDNRTRALTFLVAILVCAFMLSDLFNFISTTNP